MKRNLILGIVFLSVFGFFSMACSAQSSSNDERIVNDQRIVGTWVGTSSNNTPMTFVLNANGSGTYNNEDILAWGISPTGEIRIRAVSRMFSFTPYFSPDGRTFISATVAMNDMINSSIFRKN